LPGHGQAKTELATLSNMSIGNQIGSALKKSTLGWPTAFSVQVNPQ
jgi:hypothetical protein